MTMKTFSQQLLVIILCWLLVAPPVQGAFGSLVQWDVSTTGADTNGGGFDPGVASPGTDESTSAAVAITITLTGTNTGTGSPAFSSTTHGPGNFVHIASGTGCTTGWFEINSVSGSTATFDKTMGANTNVCVGTIGGPFLTISAILNNSLNQNNHMIWVRSGTYTLTTGLDYNQGGSNRTSTNLWGYQTTHGDNTGTRPLLTTATNSANIISTTNAGFNGVFVRNISFSDTAGTRSAAMVNQGATAYVYIDNCKFDGFSNAINMTNGSPTNYIITNSQFLNDQGTAVTIWRNASLGAISNSYFYNNAGAVNVDANSGQGTSVSISDSIFVNTTTAAAVTITNPTNGNMAIVNSTFANNSHDAVAFTGGTSGTGYTKVLFQGNVCYGQGGWCINWPASAAVTVEEDHNAYGSNTSGNFTPSNTIKSGGGTQTLTANPFTNSGSQNYAPNSTAGGGTLLKGNAGPTNFGGSPTTTTRDIGAVQSACAGGGASSCAFAKAELPTPFSLVDSAR